MPFSVPLSCLWVCFMLCLYGVSHASWKHTKGSIKKGSCMQRHPGAGSSLCPAWSCASRRVFATGPIPHPQVPLPCLAVGTASPRSLASQHGQLQKAAGAFCGHILVRSVCFLQIILLFGIVCTEGVVYPRKGASSVHHLMVLKWGIGVPRASLCSLLEPEPGSVLLRDGSSLRSNVVRPC